MNNNYFDILGLTSQTPQWWDEAAVPRFCEFKPEHCANIYAKEVILLLIRCQQCQHEFKVCCSRGTLGFYPSLLKATKYISAFSFLLRKFLGWCHETEQEKAPSEATLKSLIVCNNLHYGDPPNVDCCECGPSMNSESVRVLEYWFREKWEWVRNPKLEIALGEDFFVFLEDV